VSEKIKPVVLAIAELRESEGIGQAFSQSAEIPLNNIFKNFVATFIKRFKSI